MVRAANRRAYSFSVWVSLMGYLRVPPSATIPRHAFFSFLYLKKTKFQKYMSNMEIFKNECLSLLLMGDRVGDRT